MKRAANIAPTSLPTTATRIRTPVSSHSSGRSSSPMFVLQARVGEEQRQQQRDHEVLDAARHVLAQLRVARHDQAHHERPEDQGDADLLGGVGRQQHAGEDQRDPAAGHPAGLVVGGRGARQQRPHHQTPMTSAEERRQEDRLDHVRARAGHRHGGGQGDQEPGRHVVDRGAGQREGPHRALEHPALHEDPGQDGEGGDRHRHPHEQREGDELRVRADQLVDRAARQRSRGPSAAPRSRSRSRPPGRTVPCSWDTSISSPTRNM